MSHSLVEIYLHIIFSTKERLSLIKTEIESRLHSYICGIAIKRKCTILKINGMDDHIHIALKIHQDVPLSTLMKELKSYSSGWIKKEGYPEFSWQEGYGAFSCSKSLLEELLNYIENQKMHHKKFTFKEEIEMLEKKLGVVWLKD
jgi:REP element-mobilizing transposase RayT